MVEATRLNGKQWRQYLITSPPTEFNPNPPIGSKFATTSEV
jgi:hypothetical protein